MYCAVLIRNLMSGELGENMGTYGINKDEFLDGHLRPTEEDCCGRYGFEDFLKEFEGDVSAQTVADAWNKLSKKHKWGDTLKAVEPKEWHD